MMQETPKVHIILQYQDFDSEMPFQTVIYTYGSPMFHADLLLFVTFVTFSYLPKIFIIRYLLQ